MRRALVPVVAVLLTVSLFGACGGGDDSDTGSSDSTGGASQTTAASDDVITIENLQFGGVSSVKAGTQVKVENKDAVRHTFSPDTAGDFQGAELDGGKSTSIEFAEAGTFGYHCNIHASMKGTLEVTA